MNHLYSVNSQRLTIRSRGRRKAWRRFAVNLDVPDAVKFLQTALNMQRIFTRAFSELAIDCRLGPKTLRALSLYLDIQPGDPESNEHILLNCMNGEQYIAYKSNPQHTYFRGWFLRVLAKRSKTFSHLFFRIGVQFCTATTALHIRIVRFTFRGAVSCSAAHTL